MTFRHSIYLSFAAHVLVFGSAIAIARYAGGIVLSLPHTIQVSLVSSSPESGPVTGIARRPRSRPYQASSPTPELPVEHQNDVPKEMSAELSPTLSMQPKGDATIESIGNHDEGGPTMASASMGIGSNSGIGLISSEQWSAIESAIERTKSYPRLARERGIEGVVRLRFRLSGEGSIEKIEVIESSGSEILDTASIRAVYRAAPMPAVSGWVEVPIKYVLK